MKHLVFVDDNETLVNIMQSELEDYYNVNVFVNPQEALDYMISNIENIDILLTDFMMPQFNGLQLVTEIKKRNPKIHTIILTGYCKSMENEADIKNCDLMLDKNILKDTDDLIDEINSICL
ncbi:MAG: hypothetical protein A2Y40_08695 [Candidatus Margulisbacteria bacterium GWF2_35_9]|nr:MAG: hypothetical protein A2Y40_08695 [Candidatus Margulisbacteria bacterium GWF2_35_9]